LFNPFCDYMVSFDFSLLFCFVRTAFEWNTRWQQPRPIFMPCGKARVWTKQAPQKAKCLLSPKKLVNRETIKQFVS